MSVKYYQSHRNNTWRNEIFGEELRADTICCVLFELDPGNGKQIHRVLGARVISNEILASVLVKQLLLLIKFQIELPGANSRWDFSFIIAKADANLNAF